MKPNYFVYFIDISSDTGFIEQIKPVAYTELEIYAKTITETLQKEDDEFPDREYKYEKF